MINSTLSDVFISLVLLAFGLRALMIRAAGLARAEQDALDRHERIVPRGQAPDDDPRDRPRKRP